MKPSSSTVGSGIGIPFALVLTWYLKTFKKVEIPTEVGMAIGSAIGFFLGYIGDIIDILIGRKKLEDPHSDNESGA